ncbi:MAG: ATP synthase F1 subunit delta [Elusimicrobia bacterium]|nr:ATP synthase F1 subunit delta [Elusimicrobiota bacterium]
MKEIAVAERYAEALFRAVRDHQESLLPEMRRQLAQVTRLFQSRPEMKDALLHPLLSVENKQKNLRSALTSVQISPSPFIGRFLDLLLVKKRIHLLPLIAGEVERLWEESQKIVEASVRSAVPLEGTAKEDLSKKLWELFEKKVSLKVSVDPELIAGVIVTVGDIVIDNSLRSQLQNLKLRFEHGY